VPPQRVQVLVNDLQEYRRDAVKAAKFYPVAHWDEEKGPKAWNVGMFKWGYRWMEINKDVWKPREPEDDKK